MLHSEVQVGAEFIIELHARFESEVFERRVTFIATGDEANDVFVSAIGQGAHAEQRAGLFKRLRYSGFEFGVVVPGAATAVEVSLWPAGIPVRPL